MAHIDFTIIQSSIDNGRIYFDAADRSFFPEQAFGGRGTEERADTTVTIETSLGNVETDIRICSGARISPHRSFGKWLRAVKAQAGDRGRLVQVGEGRYRLELLG